MRIIIKSPCPIEDRELTERLMNSSGTIYTKTPLEQFNEEVMREFSIIFPNKKENNKEYTTCNCFLKFVLDDEGAWVGDRNEIKKFITQKLTEHKELILKMVRERVKESYIDYEELKDGTEEMIEPKWIISPMTFLNNLDTI